MSTEAVVHQRGIVLNLGQFTLQTIQVFFVGLTIGMERTVFPALSGEFGVAQGAYLFLASFVLSFGLSKERRILLLAACRIVSAAKPCCCSAGCTGGQ